MDEIEKLAREHGTGGWQTLEDMVKFGRIVQAAERERAARVCDDEARLRTEAGNKHPEESESRGRCFAAARAATNCAKGIRNGEVM